MTTPTFISLHTKSDFSLGIGTASVEELTGRACTLGYGTLALTDVENLSAQVRFHEECSKRRLRPVTGVELRPRFGASGGVGEREGRVILLAQNVTGYGNLCRIVTLRRFTGARSNEEDMTAGIAPYTEGIIALSDDVSVVDRLLQVMPRHRVGILLVRPGPRHADEKRRNAAVGLKVSLVADLDVSFLHKDDHLLHLLHLAIRKGLTVGAVAKDMAAESPERWLRSPAAAARLFTDVPEALAATTRIAEACRLRLPFTSVPETPLPPAAEIKTAFRRYCAEGIRRLFSLGQWTSVHQERLELELSMFDALGFTSLMAVVAEIFDHCRREGILAVARGSAVSSLVLHLLGGSPVDPVTEGLLFERFLHPGKSSWPDVDIDLPSDRRDGVIRWVFERFGNDRVAMVSVHHAFGYRSALREGLKAWGTSSRAVEQLARSLPPDDLGIEEIDFLGLAESRTNAMGQVEAAEIPAEVRKALPLVNRLVGHPRHLALHPGGIVVSPRSIEGLLPLQPSPDGLAMTQYDLVSVDRLGLVKVDLLGNRCLSELTECLTMLGERKPRFESIPLDDPATLALIDRADTMGCFQLESPAMRSLLARLPVRQMQDIVAALALIRPGAAAGEIKTSFARRARGEETVEFPFPWMEDRLTETYGLFLYEEDIMLLLHRTGHMTLGEADELRSAIIASGDDRETLSVLENRFKATAIGHGCDAAIVSKAWAIAERLAAYSFNKAHSASYARLAYFSAWTKAHHPLEFACALLDHHEGLYPLRAEAAELTRKGIKLQCAHVNLSGRRSAIEQGKDAVRVGLGKVKGLSETATEKIIAARQNGGAFATLADFLERAQLRKNEITSLILAGACDGLPPLSVGAYPFVHEALLERLTQGEPPSRLDTLSVSIPAKTDEEQLALYQGLARVRNELRYLGMHISAHPLALLRREASRYGCSTIREALSAATATSLRLTVTIAAMKRVRTRTGVMLFLSMDDETGILEAVLMPPLFRQAGSRITTPGPFLVTGAVRRQQEAVYLEIYRLDPFHERQRPFGARTGRT